MLEKKTVTIEKVQQDKSVSIDVSGFFYQRLHKLFQYYLEARSTEDYLKALEKIHLEYNDKIPEDAEALHLETFVILIRTLEEAFQKEGFIDKEDIEIDVESGPKTSD